MKEEVHEFNTNRHYAPEGQVIRWVVMDGKTFMYDKTRMLHYIFEEVCECDQDVMSCYDLIGPGRTPHSLHYHPEIDADELGRISTLLGYGA